MSYLVGREVKVGKVIEWKNRPAKVTEIHFSKTGKHGSAKGTGYAIDLFTKTKYSLLITSHDRIYSPEITKNTYIFVFQYNDKFIDIQDENGIIRSDLKYEGLLEENQELILTRVVLENKTIIENFIDM